MATDGVTSDPPWVHGHLNEGDLIEHAFNNLNWSYFRRKVEEKEKILRRCAQFDAKTKVSRSDSQSQANSSQKRPHPEPHLVDTTAVETIEDRNDATGEPAEIEAPISNAQAELRSIKESLSALQAEVKGMKQSGDQKVSGHKFLRNNLC